jgi:hypothetical protein
MNKDTKVKVVEVEEKTLQEKEKELQKKAGAIFEDGVYKVNLKDAVQKQSTDEVSLRSTPESSEKVQEENLKEEIKESAGENKKEETPVIEEITDEEVTNNSGDNAETNESVENTLAVPEQKEVLQEAKTQKKLPENIEKLITFMEETGGTLEDYVTLNKDYSSIDDATMLRSYYEKTKPHLSADEISFLIEDKFSFDEEIDEPKDIKRKKLLFKEEVAQARTSTEQLKKQYYKDIKAGSKLNSEQQKAIEFFNRYNKENEESSKIAKQQQDVFLNKTNEVFNDKFKGFEYNVGNKKYRFNVKNANEVKTAQSDLNNFVKKFLNENNIMQDAKGYHKSLFTAMNSDAIASHFYEHGRADALKQSAKEAKNINMDARGVLVNNKSGIKAKVLGENTSNLKLKLKNY